MVSWHRKTRLAAYRTAIKV